MFCFNFELPDEKKECSTISTETEVKTCPKGEALSWLPSKPFDVSTQQIKKILQDSITLEERSIGSTNIKFLSQESIDNKLDNGDVSDAITYSEELQSDLLPAVYEGGLKIWECTWDLLNYLSSSQIPLSGKRVAELGCGAGLLGIYAGLHGAIVTLQDYNEDVLKHVTLPNVVYNAAQYAAQAPEEEANNSDDEDGPKEDVSDVTLSLSDSIVSELMKRVQLYSGDWASFPEAVAAHETSLPGIQAATNGNCSKNDTDHTKLGETSSKFDVILTSETIYNQDNYQKLIDAMINCLEPSGVILLAGKAHYFGVGGGTVSFLKAVEATGRLTHTIVAHHDQGVRREIIELKFKE